MPCARQRRSASRRHNLQLLTCNLQPGFNMSKNCDRLSVAADHRRPATAGSKNCDGHRLAMTASATHSAIRPAFCKAFSLVTKRLMGEPHLNPNPLVWIVKRTCKSMKQDENEEKLQKRPHVGRGQEIQIGNPE
jgi:hypothetical protein